jgi:hypothetical protein
VILSSRLLESNTSKNRNVMRRFARAVKAKKLSKSIDPIAPDDDKASDQIPVDPIDAPHNEQVIVQVITSHDPEPEPLLLDAPDDQKVINHVPASPINITGADEDEPSSSMATPAYETVAPSTTLARITSTTPMQRLVKTLSFQSNNRIGAKSEVMYVEDSRVDSNEANDDIKSSDVPALPPVDDGDLTEGPANNAVIDSSIPECIAPSSAFAMMLAHAMSFMSDDGAEQKNSVPSSNKLKEEVNTENAFEAGEKMLYNPRILDDDVQVMVQPKSTKAVDASGPDSTTDKQDASIDVSDDARNSSAIDHDPEINAPRNMTREMSVATQRMNNKTAASVETNEDEDGEIPDSIEYTTEMCDKVNSRSGAKPHGMFYTQNIQSRSRTVFGKAKSFTKDKLSIKDTGEVSVSTKSTASHASKCLSAFSCSTSDFTEQVDNLTSTSKKRSSSKSKKQKRWREYTDPSTGKNYYSNGTTTTWSKPCLEGVAETPTPNIDAPKAETSDPTTIDNDQTAKTEVLDKSEKAGPKSKSSRLLLIPKFKSRKEKEKVCHAEDTSVGTDNNTADTEGNVSIVSSPEHSVTATNSSPTENTTPLDESVEAPKDVVRRLFV